MRPLLLLCCLALLGVTTSSARAQDAFDLLRNRTATSLNEAQQAMNESPNDAPMRAHLRQVDDWRATLIAANPDHPQTPILQLDRALDAILNEFELDGLRLMAIYGVRSDEEQARLETIRASMRDALDGVEDRITARLDALEADPNFADREQLQMERRALARIHRDVRLPVARGSLAFLDAEFGTSGSRAEQAELYRRAVDELTPVIPRLSGYTQFKVAAMAMVAAATIDDEAATARLAAILNGLPAAMLSDEQLEQPSTRPWPDGPPRLTDPERVLLDTLVLWRTEGLTTARQFYIQATINRSPLVPDTYLFLRVVHGHFFARLERAFRGSATRPILSELGELVRVAGEPTFSIDANRYGLQHMARHARSILLFEDQSYISDAALIVAAKTDETRERMINRAWALITVKRGAAGGLEHSWLRVVLDVIAPSDLETVTTARQAQALWQSLPLRGGGDDGIRAAALLLETFQIGLISARDTIGDDAFSAIVTMTRDRANEFNLPMPLRDAWRRHAAWIALRDGNPQFALNILDEQWLDHPAGFPLRIAALNALAAASANEAERRGYLQRIIETADEGILLRLQEGLGSPLLDSRLHLDAAEALFKLGDLDGCARRLSQTAQGALDNSITFRAQRLQVELTLRAGGIEPAATNAFSLIRLCRLQGDGDLEPIMPILGDVLDAAHSDLMTRWTASTPTMTEDPLLRRCSAIIEALSDAQRQRLTMSVAPLLTLAGDYDESVRLWQALAARIRPLTQPIQLGLSEARYLRHANETDWEEAFAGFAAIASGETDPTNRSHAEWLAHLRQLEMLDAMQRNTNQIGPRLRRLRTTDPSLGGPAFAPSFERLMERYLASDDGDAEDRSP